MNGQSTDAQTTALEFVSRASTYLLVTTMVLLAWVASGVEFSADFLRLAAMACLTISVACGLAALALIPRVQEARRPGQSNFAVEVPVALFGARRYRLGLALLPQYLLLLAGLILYIIGMI
jgi:hypothetical protein